MLTVGQDTYITVEQADEYITKHYRTNSKDKKRWSDLEETDKEVILRNACTELESLPWQGRKAVREQSMAFPRLPYQYGKVDDGAPQAIKNAQAELALILSDEEKTAEISHRQELQAQGVESFSIGDLSESYGGSDISVALSTKKVSSLIAPYLGGGYNVC